VEKKGVHVVFGIKEWVTVERAEVLLGNVTGYPGVFQSNLHLYPSKPVPASTAAGFRRYRSGVYKNPGVPNMHRGIPPEMTNVPRKGRASVN